MAKLYFDEVKIENSVIPNFELAIKYLYNAISEYGKMIIPNNFEFEQNLKQIGNENLNTLTKLYDMKKNMEYAKKVYKKIQNEKINDFSDIDILNINKRKSITK